MTTALTTKHDAPVWNEEQVALIKRTVAKDATNDELKMFMHLSNKYNLDPFAKEIWFIKLGGVPTITTSRDGYLKVANEHPAFAGLKSDVIYSKDSFAKTPDDVQHTYGVGDRGTILGAYALIYRKDRMFPIYVYAPIKDYAKPSNIWKTYPHAMILKVAEAMALKRAFSLSGLVTTEELGTPDAKEDVVTVEVVEAQQVDQPAPQVTPQVVSLREEKPTKEDWNGVGILMDSLEWTQEERAKYVADNFNGKAGKQLSRVEVLDLMEMLREVAEAKDKQEVA
jgi:phage recombination protein Bet